LTHYLQEEYEVPEADDDDGDGVAGAVSCALRRGSAQMGIEKTLGADDGATWRREESAVVEAPLASHRHRHRTTPTLRDRFARAVG